MLPLYLLVNILAKMDSLHRSLLVAVVLDILLHWDLLHMGQAEEDVI
jgi:hypothetical protein